MDQAVQPQEVTQAPGRFGLAARVLCLIVAFVVIAEVAIFLPLVANFRSAWLANRLAAAYTAALVLDAAPEGRRPIHSSNRSSTASALA